MSHSVAVYGNASYYYPQSSAVHAPAMNLPEQEPLILTSGAGGLDRIQGVASPPPLPTINLSHFTTWGNGLSFGRLVGDAVRLPGRGLEKIGEYCETSDWRGVRSFGSSVKFLGNLIGAVGGIAGQLITVSERLLLNGLKGLGGVTLVIVGAVTRPFGNTSLLDRGVVWLKGAWMTRGEVQDMVSSDDPHRMHAIQAADKMCSAVNDCIKFLYGMDLVMSAKQGGGANVTPIKIPERWQNHYTRGDNNSYDIISGLSVPVAVKRGSDGTVFIAFPGMHDGHSFASAILCALGVADETFRKAREIVQDFATMYPGKVHVLGHSLGGALAQYAGIKADVPVTCFNSMGLSAGMTDQLVDLSEVGQGKLTRARVEHFNSGDDWLAQKLQTRYAPFGLSQLGQRHKASAFSGYANGHAMGSLCRALNEE